MNKKKGVAFEKEFCNILALNKFWARMDKGFAQACDIIAGKNNKIYLIECKTVKEDYFNLSRVEDNQNTSREFFKHCGNDNAYFVFKLDSGEIYLSKEPISKPSDGIILERWLEDES